ncbi:hypothetical protein [Cryobacterium sp. BB307]|uniref:hypothetical protein n=1 Tax=Cryobacterium sp. BB307 TaxID=2716317 RepID=UPI0014469C25|nr:hypothetical protein [Cryobacterium sp. BB307]
MAKAVARDGSRPQGLKTIELEDVRALLNVEANKRRLGPGKAHALEAMSNSHDKPIRRESIPQAAGALAVRSVSRPAP